MDTRQSTMNPDTLRNLAPLGLLVAALAIGACSNNNTAPSTTPTTTTTASAIQGATVVQIGQTQGYTFTPTTSTTVITWTSNNPDVLIVDDSGMATGLDNGVATLTGISDSGTSAMLTV